MKPVVISLPTHPDERGVLTVCEQSRHVPFDIKRVYWIYNVPEGQMRGAHAHKLCEQVLVPVAGRFTVATGAGDRFTLNDPRKALYVPPEVYLLLSDFSPGACCLVLCSHHYDEEDYVKE